MRPWEPNIQISDVDSWRFALEGVPEGRETCQGLPPLYRFTVVSSLLIVLVCFVGFIRFILSSLCSLPPLSSCCSPPIGVEVILRRA